MGSGASSEGESSSRQSNTRTPSEGMHRRNRTDQFEEREIHHAQNHVTEGYQGSRGQINGTPNGTNGSTSQQRRGAPGGTAERWQNASIRATAYARRNELYDVVKSVTNAPDYVNNDDLIFETFLHHSGQQFQSLVQNGLRFYLDSWHSQQWQPFPGRWYNEGTLVVDSVVRGEPDPAPPPSRSQPAESQPSTSHHGASTSNDQPREGRRTRRRRQKDDREGILIHPTRGRLETYMFEEKKNVHCYFDKNTGQWVRMPVGWELHSDTVKDMTELIGDTLPDWGNATDILATLRACNYDAHDCIANYFTVGYEDDPWLQSTVKGSGGSLSQTKLIDEKDAEIKQLKKKVAEMEESLQRSQNTIKQEREEKSNLNSRINELQDKVSSLEVEVRSAAHQIEALQNQRPKTARPKTPKVITKTEIIEKDNVDPESIKELNNTAKALHKANVRLKMSVQQNITDMNQLLSKAIQGVKQLKGADSGQSKELEELRELYRRETLQRKLLYNKLQELRGNIRVFARCRRDDRVECSLTFPGDHEILAYNPNTQQKKKFEFDKVYTPFSTQTEVFADTLPIITSCVDGYNVCILAYGQTGSGKTHTMMGPESDPGVNIRSIQELLKICQERKDTWVYTLNVSMLEIYNETVQDLLTNDAKTLNVQSKGNKVIIQGLTEMPVNTVSDIKAIMTMGDKNRTTAATKMNSASSRSHLIVMIKVAGQDKVSGSKSAGSLMLCDLAGSERVSKTDASGQRLVEAAAINKSLTALGQVFTALRTSQLHVPYRNSKLTHILQPALGGDAKACLFVALSPDANNITESISTMTFGSNARQVALGQAKQNISKKRPPVEEYDDDY